jgi:hypothetical protein
MTVKDLIDSTQPVTRLVVEKNDGKKAVGLKCS